MEKMRQYARIQVLNCFFKKKLGVSGVSEIFPARKWARPRAYNI